MSDGFASLCDDFCVDMFINTELELPTDRDIVLSFFDRIQKNYPTMGHFYRRENGDYCLDEDREEGSYRWMVLELDRICSGYLNPGNVDAAYDQHREVISLLPYMLGVNHLDIASVDVSFTMSLDYTGSHDEIVSEAFFRGTAFNSILDMPGTRPIGFSPRLLYSLSDDCRTQLRLSIDSKTSIYEVRTQKYNQEEPVTLTAMVRKYPRPDTKFDLASAFEEQKQLLENITADKIIPEFVRPLASAIAHRQ